MAIRYGDLIPLTTAMFNHGLRYTDDADIFEDEGD